MVNAVRQALGGLCPHSSNTEKVKFSRFAKVIALVDKIALINKIVVIKKHVAARAYSAALTKLKNDVLKKMDGYLSGAVKADDWIKDLDVQQQLCSEIQKIWVMLVLVGA
jgi:hypothetical protein